MARDLRRPRRRLGASAGARRFWNLAAAMFEAQHHGLLGFDVFTKRVASRLLAQFRLLQRGDSDVSERLARDVLFFCAQSAPAGREHSRAAPGGRARGLRLRRADADRLLAQRPRPLRSGDRRPRQEARRGRQGSLVGDGRRRDAPPRRPLRAVRAGRRFAAAPVPVRRDVRRGAADRGAADQAAQAAPPAPLAMEVATSLLYLEAALEDGDFDQPEHAERVKRLGERLAARPPEAAARAARAVDGGALPPRLRPADDGQRRPGAARLAVRGREVDRQVLPQPRRPRGAARGAGAAAARCAACCSVLGMDAASQALLQHARRGRRPGLDRGRSREGEVGRRLRSPGRQPVGARLHDRHAERAAAAWPSRSSSTTPAPARWRPSWGAARRRNRLPVPHP